MKQSNNKKTNAPATPYDKTIAFYLRISREDGNDESYSIGNQRKLLQKVARDKGFTNFIEFVDDGVTGTKKDRKEFRRMLDMIEQNKATFSAVIVKDVSRFARDYIRAGLYTEEIFPEHDIRFISVGEGVDSADGENPYLAYMNLTAEQYARDISRKCKLSNMVRGTAGEPLSLPPYGYMKNPENPKQWLIDEEPAAVVRRIYRLTLDGKGTEQIAGILQQDKILTPMNYWQSKGFNRGGLKNLENPYKWNSSTIVKILSLQEYCGDVLNFKTYSKSFKLKKRIKNSEENMIIFRDVHEPIIDRDSWEKVQAQRGKVRKRKTNEGVKNMFSGLLVCADCGKNLWYHFNQGNPEITYFNCSNYKGNRGTCTSTHYVRVDFLEQVVLQEVRRLTQFATKYEKEFIGLIEGRSQRTAESARQRKQKEIYKLTARDRELDKIFNHMYEDNISGKIDDERFARMTRQYAVEQKELAERIKRLQMEVEKEEYKANSTDTFLKTVRRYTNAKQLTEQMLNELIEKIEVHHAERIDGENMQSLIIHYNCVGYVEIPNKPQLPETDVTVYTRQGVATSYTPARVSA